MRRPLAEPFARAREHRARPGTLAEHGAREDMQHHAVVERLEPPDREHRGPRARRTPSRARRAPEDRRRTSTCARVHRPPPALQHARPRSVASHGERRRRRPRCQWAARARPGEERSRRAAPSRPTPTAIFDAARHRGVRRPERLDEGRDQKSIRRAVHHAHRRLRRGDQRRLAAEIARRDHREPRRRPAAPESTMAISSSDGMAGDERPEGVARSRSA